MLKYLIQIKNEFNLEEKGKNVLYGTVNGYEVTIIGSQTITVFLNFFADSSTKNLAANTFAETNGSRMTKVTVDNFGLSASINGMTANSAAKSAIAKINATTTLLNQKEVSGISACPLCGSQFTSETKTIKLNDRYITMDDNCITRLSNLVSEAEENYNNSPNNYLKGSIGAALGAAIACAAWVIVYLIGFISAITAILGVYLSDIFYVKFGGKSNKMKLVLIGSINFIAIMLTCTIFYYILAVGLMAANQVTGNVFNYIMTTTELKEAFIYDMLLNVLFTLLGIGYIVYNIYRKNKNNHAKIEN